MRFLLVLGLSLAFSAQKTNSITLAGGLLQGRDYIDLNDDERAAYAAGFFNGLTMAAPVEGLSEGRVSWLENCTKGMNARQIAAIISKHIQDRPAQWHFSLNVLSYNAMNDACSPYRTPEKIR